MTPEAGIGRSCATAGGGAAALSLRSRATSPAEVEPLTPLEKSMSGLKPLLGPNSKRD